MKNKVRDFVYFDANRYISLESIKIFYWATIIILFIPILMGFVTESPFLILLTILYSIIYWVFYVAIKSKYVKKSFELRFLVNGIFGVLMSTLFTVLLVSICVYSDLSDILGAGFLLWNFFSYILFIFMYFLFIIISIHKGLFKKIKEKSQRKNFLFVSSIATALFPFMGILGIYVSRIVQSVASFKIQIFLGIGALVSIIFLIGLSYINFIQFYYCIKYKINCDKNGCATSANLEPISHKDKISKKTYSKKNNNQKMYLILKILIGMVCVLVAIFIILLIIGISINL